DTARLEHLDRDAVAGCDPPPPRRRRTDSLDHAHHLVTGHEREAAAQHARVLLVVRAAEATGFDAQQPRGLTDVGEGKFARLQPPGLVEHERPSLHAETLIE